jgi:hypothetical protein
MQIIGYILFFGIGLVQLAAVFAGFSEWMNLPFILAILAAIIVTYVPILGLIAGVGGAVTAWDWPAWQAILLFIWPLVGVVLISSGEAVLDRFHRR